MKQIPYLVRYIFCLHNRFQVCYASETSYSPNNSVGTDTGVGSLINKHLNVYSPFHKIIPRQHYVWTTGWNMPNLK